jgi:hypothetical protein
MFLPAYKPCKDFESFLWCLGSPVNLDSHKGFRGSLSTETCPVTPYFANLTSEIIFKSPYLYRKDCLNGTIQGASFPKKRTQSSSGDISNSYQDISSLALKMEVRSRSFSSTDDYGLYNGTFAAEFENDIAAIVWVYNILNFR